MMIKNIFLKIIFVLAILVILTGVAYGVFFIWKITTTENKINIESDDTTSFFDTFKNIVTPGQINLQGMTDERINILLLGIAGHGKPGNNLTDTIMIASLNSKTGKVALLSVPRDLYVQVPETLYTSKINAIYEYGLRSYPNTPEKMMGPLEGVIKNITSLDIHYWVVLNFDGFEKIVDAIDGINITNPRDIYDPSYPGPGYSYETFELSQGFHHLDGAVALKYARMRHNDPEGDFGRAKRQQQVMQAIKNKVFSTGTLLNAVTLNQLFDALGENVKTNISSSEFGDFLQLVKKLDTNNINNVVFDAWKSESLLKGSHVAGVSALVPRVGNWSETREVAQNIFNTNEIKRKREEISKENATVVIINKSGNNLVSSRIIKLLKDSFGYKNVVILTDRNKNLEEATFVYDLTNGNSPFTLNELIKKLSAKNSSTLDLAYKNLISNVSADLVLVIGQDLIPHYSMAELDFKDYNEDSDVNDYMYFGN
jgi:LCP family protein required for cell wall assembly